MVFCARDARRSVSHPAAGGAERTELDTEAKKFVTGALQRLGVAVKQALGKVRTVSSKLASQIEPVEAAYRTERRDAALREVLADSTPRPFLLGKMATEGKHWVLWKR